MDHICIVSQKRRGNIDKCKFGEGSSFVLFVARAIRYTVIAGRVNEWNELNGRIIRDSSRCSWNNTVNWIVRRRERNRSRTWCSLLWRTGGIPDSVESQDACRCFPCRCVIDVNLAPSDPIDFAERTPCFEILNYYYFRFLRLWRNYLSQIMSFPLRAQETRDPSDVITFRNFFSFYIYRFLTYYL